MPSVGEMKRNQPVEEAVEFDNVGLDDATKFTKAEELVPWKADRQEWLIILCLCLINCVVALDATIIVPALPTIANALGASTLSTFWIGSSYLLTHAVIQPVISALSDIFGRQLALLASMIFFTIGSLLACLAHGAPQMLAGRVVQGIGGGGIIVLTVVIISEIVPLRQRPLYISIIQLSWAFGTVTGPILGGAFTQSVTWRWIFYLNFPFCVIGIAMVPMVVRYRRLKTKTIASLANLDWVGGILFIGGTVGFLMAVTWGGVQFSWKSAQTLVPLLLGLFAIILSLIWQIHFAKYPFIDFRIYNNRSAAAALICTLLQGLLLYLGLYYISLFFLSVKRQSPIHTGIDFLPMMLALLPSSAITGVLVSRSGRFQEAVWFGWCLITLGNGVLIMLDASTKTVYWVFWFTTAGIGQGIIVTTLNIAIQASMQAKNAANAAALYAFLRSLGMAIGVGIGGATFQNRLAHHLAAAGLPTDISMSAEGFVHMMYSLPKSEQGFVDAVLDAFAEAFHNLFTLSTSVAGLALLLSLGVRQASMDQALDSKHVLESKNEPGKVVEGETC